MLTEAERQTILGALDAAYRAVGSTRSDGRLIRDLLSVARAILIAPLEKAHHER